MLSIDLDDHEFGDGRYRFALTLSGIEEIQKKSGHGIGAVHRRVLTGVYQVEGKLVTNGMEAEFSLDEIVETIRQGLIGGGSGMVDEREVSVTPALANRLVKTYVIDRPLNEGWELAAAILLARVVGYEPDAKKKPSNRAKKKTAKAE